MKKPNEKLTTTLEKIKDKPAGARFRYAYKKINTIFNKNIFIKSVFALLGGLLIFLGVILLFIPGPGILSIILGLSMLCLISKRVALLLDRIENNINKKLNHNSVRNKDQ